MVRPCPPTMALPSAFALRVTLVGKAPNIFRESLSQTVGITTEKRGVLGTEAFEVTPKFHLSARGGFKTSSFLICGNETFDASLVIFIGAVACIRIVNDCPFSI